MLLLCRKTTLVTTRDSGILKNENRLSLLNLPPDSSDCLIINDKEEVIKREGNSQFRESGVVSAGPESGDPVDIYHSLAGLKPNPVQRRMMQTSITNLSLWRAVVEHWLFHGWNPKNISGMLELYLRGGASGCQYCHADQKPAQKAKSGPASTHEALEELRREMGHSTGPVKP